MQLLGGAITAYSEGHDRGASFVLRLPLLPSLSQATTDPSNPELLDVDQSSTSAHLSDTFPLPLTIAPSVSPPPHSDSSVSHSSSCACCNSVTSVPSLVSPTTAPHPSPPSGPSGSAFSFSPCRPVPQYVGPNHISLVVPAPLALPAPHLSDPSSPACLPSRSVVTPHSVPPSSPAPCVTQLLPNSPLPRTSSPSRSHQTPAPGRPTHSHAFWSELPIVLVEDAPVLLMMLEQSIRRMGFTKVFTASSVQEALEIFQNRFGLQLLSASSSSFSASSSPSSDSQSSLGSSDSSSSSLISLSLSSSSLLLLLLLLLLPPPPPPPPPPPSSSSSSSSSSSLSASSCSPAPTVVASSSAAASSSLLPVHPPLSPLPSSPRSRPTVPQVVLLSDIGLPDGTSFFCFHFLLQSLFHHSVFVRSRSRRHSSQSIASNARSPPSRVSEPVNPHCPASPGFASPNVVAHSLVSTKPVLPMASSSHSSASSSRLSNVRISRLSPSSDSSYSQSLPH